ncbi:MAG: hypothetical protein KC917_21885, partial [Candidatus Omnitrophica bacterium]|nr:hypothetical protein [Candidatus Omnitrophota bacterium]
IKYDPEAVPEGIENSESLLKDGHGSADRDNALQNEIEEQTSPRLQFRLVSNSKSEEGVERLPLREPNPRDGDSLPLEPEVLFSEKDVISAKPGKHPGGEGYHITGHFDQEAAKRWSDVTGRNVDRRMAIIFDGEILSAPTIRDRISGGKCIIAADFTEAEARSIADAIVQGGKSSANGKDKQEEASEANIDSATEIRSIRIRVEDRQGDPIEGAEILPTGFRPKDNPGAHAGWFAKDVPATWPRTDSQGWATFPFLRSMGPVNSEVGEITFRIDHPNYCTLWGNQKVEEAEKTFNLDSGATVVVSAYMGNKENKVSDFIPQITTQPYSIGTEID